MFRPYVHFYRKESNMNKKCKNDWCVRKARVKGLCMSCYNNKLQTEKRKYEINQSKPNQFV
jgi:hypothetical protein